MSVGIAPEAVAVSIVVLLYSFFCAFLCIILVGLLVSFGESFSYVTIEVSATGLATLASIAQQVHYVIRWHEIRQSKYDRALLAVKLPGLAFIGGSNAVDRPLFLIQFWCYNIMAINIFFWSIALFTSAWGIRAPFLGAWYSRVGPISKLFAILFPSIIIGMMHSKRILRSRITTFVAAQGTICVSLMAGAVFLVLTLYRYVKTRRLASGSTKRGRWWASQSPQGSSSNHEASLSSRTIARNSIYDRALLTRFTIGFVVLFFFLGCLIMFTSLASKGIATVIASGHADFRKSSTIVDILLFLPGVTGSLLTFLIFGTTKSWQNYRDLLLCNTKGVKARDFRGRFNNMRRRVVIKVGRRNGRAAESETGVVFSQLDDLRPGLDTKINQDHQSSDSDLSSNNLPIMSTESTTTRTRAETSKTHSTDKNATSNFTSCVATNPTLQPAYFPPLSRYSSWNPTSDGPLG